MSTTGRDEGDLSFKKVDDVEYRWREDKTELALFDAADVLDDYRVATVDFI